MNKALKIFLVLTFMIFILGCNDSKDDNNNMDKYSVEYIVEGKTIKVDEVDKGGFTSAPTVEEVEGYEFKGWYLDGVPYDLSLPITGNLKIEALFEQKKITVIFVDQSDTVIETLIINYGEAIKEDEAPKVSINNEKIVGYFLGVEEYDFNTKVTSDLKITIKTETTSHSVSFVDENGDLMKQIEVTNGSTISQSDIPEYSISEWYVFRGWYYQNENYDFSNIISSDITLKLTTEIKKFTVTFFNDDVEVGSVIVEYGCAILPDDYPKVEGFQLISIDKDLSSVKSDLKVFCEYKQVYHVVLHDIKGNPVEEFNIIRGQKIEDITYSIESDKMFKYTIKDWYKEPELINVFKLTRAVTMDLNLYPKVIATPIKESYEGMTISILGDSISTYYSSTSDVNSYYGGNNQYYYPLYSSTVKKASDTWWYKALDLTKTKLGINNSWSGSNAYGSSASSGMGDSRLNTLDDNGTPDIVIIYLGTNDNVNGYSSKEFATAIRTIMSKINEKYPQTYIMCFNLGYTAYTGYYYTDQKRLAYNEEIMNICKEFKAKVIDLAALQTETTYVEMLGDSLHPNAYGMDLISIKVASEIKDYFSDGIAIN